MKNHDMTEQAYKNGYAKGYEDGKKDAESVVHGEWLDGCAIHKDKEVYKSIDCSVCEEVFKIESHDREYWKKRFERCFCCGAVMDGGCCDG